MAEQKLLVKREGDFHYPIYFKNDFQDLAGAIREEGLENRKICIVTDSHVAPLYHEAVKSALQEISSEIFSFVFEAGEKNKNLNTVQELYKTLIENEMDRKGLLVALGGGVVRQHFGECSQHAQVVNLLLKLGGQGVQVLGLGHQCLALSSSGGGLLGQGRRLLHGLQGFLPQFE